MTRKNVILALGAAAVLGLFGTMAQAAPMLPAVGAVMAGSQAATVQQIGYRGGRRFSFFRGGYGARWFLGRQRQGGGHGGGYGYGGGHRR